MDAASISVAVTAVTGLIDWRTIAQKFVGDTAAEISKAGRARFLRHCKPSETEEIAKQAVLLFTEEFLKELDDKAALSVAIPGYYGELKRLIEAASRCRVPLPRSASAARTIATQRSAGATALFCARLRAPALLRCHSPFAALAPGFRAVLSIPAFSHGSIPSGDIRPDHHGSLRALLFGS